MLRVVPVASTPQARGRADRRAPGPAFAVHVYVDRRHVSRASRSVRESSGCRARSRGWRLPRCRTLRWTRHARAARRRERERHVVSRGQPTHRRAAVRERAQLPLAISPEKPAAVPGAGTDTENARIRRRIGEPEAETAMHRTGRTRHLATRRHDEGRTPATATEPRGELHRVIESGLVVPST